MSDQLHKVQASILNALRHTPEGGTICLQAFSDEDSTILSVIDSGAGITPEHVPHVFERFYKVDLARPGGAEGSGLGLSVAKAVVDRHGGTITVDSAPGHTEFRVRLRHQLAEPTFDDAQALRAGQPLVSSRHSASTNL